MKTITSSDINELKAELTSAESYVKAIKKRIKDLEE